MGSGKKSPGKQNEQVPGWRNNEKGKTLEAGVAGLLNKMALAGSGDDRSGARGAVPQGSGVTGRGLSAPTAFLQ